MPFSIHNGFSILAVAALAAAFFCAAGPGIATAEDALIVVDSLGSDIDGDTRSLGALMEDPGPDGVITLPEAVEAANMTDGAETIIFADGLRGVVLLPRKGLDFEGDADGIALIGPGDESVILDGSLTEDGESCIMVSAPESTIAGMRIQRCTDAAIWLGNTRSCTIVDNVLTDNQKAGVYISAPGSGERCTDNVVERNRILDNGFAGVMIHEADDNLISENEIRSPAENVEGNHGVVVLDGRDNTIAENTFVRFLNRAISISDDAEGTVLEDNDNDVVTAGDLPKATAGAFAR